MSLVRESRDTVVFLPLAVGDTPLVDVTVAVGGRRIVLRLKLESFNPCGSIKDRTAMSLYDSVRDRTDPSVGLVESTSGNLGVALASLARSDGVPFTAVVDPRTPTSALRSLHRLGATVVVASEPDGRGGYLLSRLRAVHDLLCEYPALRWTNQYDNPANPRAHEFGTGVELSGQVGPGAVVLAPVSTGGTLAGLRAHAAKQSPGWTVVGVDVHGSHALGYTPGTRLLSGIGSSRPSSFTSDGDGPALRLHTQDAVSACVWLLEECGIGVGASSGALVAAALRLAEEQGLSEVVCVCPDGAANYLNTVYSEAWRVRNGLAPQDVGAVVESVEWE